MPLGTETISGTEATGKLAVSGHVIEHLRQQAADVDGICGSEKGALAQGFVGEGLLDQALAIVKGAGNFERGDVFAESGELFFLGFADAFGRIKNHDADARDAQKSMGNGASGVARCGDQDGEGRGIRRERNSPSSGPGSGRRNP